MNKPNREEQHHSKTRHEEAVRQVINDLLSGATYSVLFIKLTEDGYGLDYCYSNSMAQKIITQARKRLREDYKEALPQFREQLTHILLDIVTEAREMGDRGNAIKAVQEVAKLVGAYEPTKVEAKVENYVIDFQLTDEENTD